MKTLLKGGTVVSAAGSCVADVLVDGEKIAAVGIRARHWATGLISGTKKPTAGPAATTVST